MDLKMGNIRWREIISFLPLILIFAGGCLSDEDHKDKFYVFSYSYDFNEEQYGWTGDFTQYPVKDSTSYALKCLYTELPANLNPDQKSWLITGNNQGSELFMYIKKQITSLEPNTEYTVAFKIEFATNAQRNNESSNGVISGENVFLKVGAIATEPVKKATAGIYSTNIDKGPENSSGTDMMTIGDIATDSANFALETRTNKTSIKAMSDNDGALWLIVGTDSSQKGLTTLYYTKITAVLSLVTN